MRLVLWMIASLCFLLTACSQQSQSYFLGYIEGKYIYLSSPVSGIVTRLAVQKGENVAAHQLAFQLDPEPELSQLQNAQATLVYTRKMFERNQDLRKTRVVSEAVVDLSRQQYESAVHQVNQYQWIVSQKTVSFPQAGFVQNTLFRQNEYVPAGQPVIQFLPPENRVVVFYIPETKLSTIHRGQSIYFTCDHCAKKFSAIIDYISSRAEYTPPVIYSKDSREKLVYWVEAHLQPADANQLQPGEPVEVTLHA